MKILYLLTNLNRTAPNTVIINILKTSNNKNMFVVSLNKSEEDNYKVLLQKMGIEYYEFESIKTALLKINHVFKMFNKIDILHTNGYHANIYAYFLKKLNEKIRLISTCHSVENMEVQSYNYKGINYLKSRVKLFLQKKLYLKHDKVIAVSNEVKLYLNSIGCFNVTTIYNGINFDTFPNLQTRKMNPSTINICQIGHVIPLKNQMFSLKLVNYLKKYNLNIKIHFFGSLSKDIDYVKSLKEKIKEFNIEDNVVFYEHLAFDKLYHYLNDMNIILMPSLSEGMPLSLLEAMYFKLAAIVSNKGGMKEVISNNKNGLVIKINNDKDFCRIHEYIKCEKYINDGRINRKLVLESFCSKIMVERYQEEYLKLLL